MFYIALVNESGDILYPEHYEEKVGMELCRYPYTTQAANELGNWKVYTGEEPYECVLARASIIRGENESPEDFAVRVGIAVQDALKSSTSVLNETMVDDEPEWHKLGYQTLEEYEAHNPKG